MTKRRADEALTDDIFKKLYIESNGFIPSINNDCLTNNSEVDFFQMLEEGCNLLNKIDIDD